MTWRDRARTVSEEPKASSWRDRAKPIKETPSDDYALKGASLLRKAGAAGLEGIGKISRAVDSVTGAPVRAAVGKLQDGGGLGDAWDSARNQFAEDPNKAPSGKDIAAKAGLSTDESINTGVMLNPFTRETLKLSPAGIAGAGVEAATDPTTYIPGRLVAKGLEGAGQGIKALAPPVAKYLNEIADVRAFKAASGQNKRAFKNLTKTGQLENFGREIRQADEAGEAVVGPFSRAEDIKPRAEAKKNYFGGKIGEVSNEIDKMSPKAVSGASIAAKIENYMAEIPATPKNQAVLSALQKEAEFYRSAGNMSFADAQKAKGTYVFKPTDSTTQVLGQDATNAVRGIVGKEMDDTVARISQGLESKPIIGQELANEVRMQVNAPGVQAVGREPIINLPGLKSSRSPRTGMESIDIAGSSQAAEQSAKNAELKSLLDKYSSYKQKYGANKTAYDVATDRVLSNQSIRFASPSDYGVGLGTGLAAAMAGGGPSLSSMLVAAVAGGANKIARERGSAMASRSAGAIAKMIDSSPDQFAKWLPALQNGAKRGAEGLSVTHHLLMNNDPEYRQMVEARK